MQTLCNQWFAYAILILSTVFVKYMTLQYTDLIYWTHGYTALSMNRYLREGIVRNDDEDNKVYVKEECSKFIEAASVPLDFTGTLYRGTCLARTGNSSLFIEDKGLLSFSKDIEVAERFAKARAEKNGSIPVIIVLEDSSIGLDVDLFFEKLDDYDHNTQQEVIIPPSRFKVIERVVTEDNTIMQYCEVKVCVQN